uniref:Uncharacterized protein n=1 Tax=Xiphophorus couchianus TaxID=32473 RepID=A0A3B5M2X7_9TELE
MAKALETQDQKEKTSPSTGKPKDNSQADNLTEVPDVQTAENVQQRCLNEIQNLPHSSENTSQAKCSCLATFKETELKYKDMQKYLMTQLDEMFDTNKKLSAKLRQQQELVKKLQSESRQSRNSMVSVQRVSQDNPKQKTVNYQPASAQTEMDGRETRFSLKPVSRTISTQTEMDGQETSSNLKPSNNEMQKYLMKQLDEMFDTNKKLSAKLRQQQELARKGLSESRQSKKLMVSVQTQTDSQEIPKQKTANYQSAATQTEMDLQETSYPVKPVTQTASTQTEMDLQETSYPVKPVSQTASTQTEMDLQETSYPVKPVTQTASTQTEMDLQETSYPVKPVSQTASTQTEMDLQETSYPVKPVTQTASTQTEMDLQETSYPVKPVSQTASTQTEMDLQETSYPVKPVTQTTSTQTEISLVLQKQPSETQLNGHQDQQTKTFKRSTGKNRTDQNQNVVRCKINRPFYSVKSLFGIHRDNHFWGIS